MIRTSATTLPGNLDLNNLLGGILNNGGMNPQVSKLVIGEIITYQI